MEQSLPHDVPANQKLLEFYDTTNKINRLEDMAFNNCTSLSTCYFPKVTNVGVQSFYSCQSLISANFDSCTTFGDNVFEGCFTYSTDGHTKIYALKDMWCRAVNKRYIQDNYVRIKIPVGCNCHCSDGDYTVPEYSY